MGCDLQAGSEEFEPLLSAAVAALCSELQAPRWPADFVGSSVPQYVAAIEAAGSIGQALKDHFASGSSVGLDSTLALTAGLQHAEAQDMAEYRANVSRNPDRAGSGGIPHATIALAKLGVGTDARGQPLRRRQPDAAAANLSLIDKDKGESWPIRFCSLHAEGHNSSC